MASNFWQQNLTSWAVMGHFFSQFATRFEIIIFILMYSVLILNVMCVLYIHTIESELKKISKVFEQKFAENRL